MIDNPNEGMNSEGAPVRAVGYVRANTQAPGGEQQAVAQQQAIQQFVMVVVTRWLPRT